MDTKALKIMTKKNAPHYVIGWEGGGEVPLKLSGSWTSISAAQTAINIYVKSKEKLLSVKPLKERLKETVKVFG